MHTMTRDDIEKAIAYFNDLLQTIADDEFNAELRENSDTALTALREARGRTEGGKKP
jgi:hypothetical protein